MSKERPKSIAIDKPYQDLYQTIFAFHQLQINSVIWRYTASVTGQTYSLDILQVGRDKLIV